MSDIDRDSLLRIIVSQIQAHADHHERTHTAYTPQQARALARAVAINVALAVEEMLRYPEAAKEAL